MMVSNELFPSLAEFPGYFIKVLPQLVANWNFMPPALRRLVHEP